MFFVSRGLCWLDRTKSPRLAASTLQVNTSTHPAINGDGDAGEKGRPLGGEKAHQIGDLLGQSDAPEWEVSTLLLLESFEILAGGCRLLSLKTVPSVRLDGARRHRGDEDIGRGAEIGQSLREVNECRIGRAAHHVGRRRVARRH